MELVFLVKELVKSGNYRLTFHAEIERDAVSISSVALEEVLTHKKCEIIEDYPIKNIKAEVCRQCAEVFFSPDTLKLIGKYVVEKNGGKKTISVPVIEMSDMAIV